VFEAFFAIVSFVSGAIASIAGFGIGSLLTPLLATKTGIGLAVAGVSIIHLVGTVLRFFVLRKHLSRSVFISFGLTSAVGGLAGALLHNVLQNVALTIVFGLLLVAAGLSGLTGVSERIRIKGVAIWLAGAASGLFGGLVGNQGGIRSAAMLSFKLERDQFVATATGIALMVDVARVPVYLTTQWHSLVGVRVLIAVGIIGVVLGTLAGKRVLERLPQNAFKKTVAAIILAIGILVLVRR
jgi:uncharacterized protein